MHHSDRLKNTCVKISTWKVCITSRFGQRRGKLEKVVFLQIFYLLIYLKLVNQNLKIMQTRLQIPKEKLKLDKVGTKEYQSTCQLKLLFLHHLQIKTKTLNVYLHLTMFGFTFSVFRTITTRYPMGYLLFIMPRLEKEGELCQGFQAFLYILKARGYSTSVTERKIPIFNPISFCVIFEENLEWKSSI